MMKRLASITAALALLALLCCGCGNDAPESSGADTDSNETPQITGTGITEPALPSEDELRAESLAAQLRENMPRTDGSTSAIPLETAIRASIFGISSQEAEAQVVHTTSHDSFYNLLEGKCDIIFCHLLSEDQYLAAQARQIEIEQAPISREGFVFVVSRDNPVESLTVEQLRGIYSGKITNWSEVGGDDKPIAAYQRNLDSGSQNYMTVFMEGLPLTDAPTELRPSSMDQIVDVVAAYNGESGGIGYSVYSYVGGMYDANNGVKILKVNGVAPEFKSIADGSYPCTGCNYVVMRADEPEGSPARLLLEWILTETGQRAVAGTGYYAPLEPASGIEVTIRGLKLSTQTGTGPADAKPASWYYYETLATEPIDYGYGEEYLAFERKFQLYGTVRPVTGNAALDNEVELYLRDETARMVSFALPADENSWEEIPTVAISYDFGCINGMLSVEITRGRYYSGAMWDIESGRRLSLSDLFTEGAAFIPQLNDAIQKSINYVGAFGSPMELIRPFAGLEEWEYGFTLMNTRNPYSNEIFYNREVCLKLYMNPYDNSYFNNAEVFYISPRSLENFAAAAPRKLSAGENRRAYWKYDERTLRRETFDGENYDGEYRWIDIGGYAGAERINAAVYEFLKTQFDIDELTWSDKAVEKALKEYADLLRGNYNIDDPTREDLHRCRIVVNASVTLLGDKYAAVVYCARVAYDDAIGYGGMASDYKLAVYELDSGNLVDSSVIYDPSKLTGDWYYNHKSISAPDDAGTLAGIFFGDQESLYDENGNLFFPEVLMLFKSPDGEYYTLLPDEDCLRWFD